MNKLPKIIVLVGPTASGKTAMSLKLAKKYGGEIVNADSRQVYRKMDIGTAKAKKDNGVEFYSQGIRHHLINIANPDEEFTLAEYKKLAFETIDDIISQGKLPIIVGGTGLYVWAVVDNLDIPAVAPNTRLRGELEKKSANELVRMLEEKDPDTANRIDLKNPRRVIRALEIVLSLKKDGTFEQKKLLPKYEALQIGLNVNRESLTERINERVDQQIRDGLVEEVKKLAEKYSWKLPSMSGIGYKQIGYYLRGEISLPEAVEMIKRDTRRYAKRQMTWFRREKRINWIDALPEAENLIEEFIKK